jgi:hypothetical protein
MAMPGMEAASEISRQLGIHCLHGRQVIVQQSGKDEGDRPKHRPMDKPDPKLHRRISKLGLSKAQAR